MLTRRSTRWSMPGGLSVASAIQRSSEGMLAAENSLIEYAANSILIGAFPNNPNFYFSAAGIPSATTPVPTSVTTAVSTVTNNLASGAVTGDLKNYFGQIDI